MSKVINLGDHRRRLEITELQHNEQILKELDLDYDLKGLFDELHKEMEGEIEQWQFQKNK